MEGLELRPGLSFLNVGSGTGYLSTLVGLIIGSSGISHGVEVHPLVVEYSTKKMSQFLENSPTLDEFDFCEPKFYGGKLVKDFSFILVILITLHHLSKHFLMLIICIQYFK